MENGKEEPESCETNSPSLDTREGLSLLFRLTGKERKQPLPPNLREDPGKRSGGEASRRNNSPSEARSG